MSFTQTILVVTLENMVAYLCTKRHIRPLRQTSLRIEFHLLFILFFIKWEVNVSVAKIGECFYEVLTVLI